MAATYYAQILSGWDWPAIAADINTAANALRDHLRRGRTDVTVETGYAWAGAAEFGYESTFFLGTVFNLTPSGKYYMPWACSNVTIAEAERDARWFEALEKVCDKYGLYTRSGEGDPCDIFVAMGVDADDE
jgi:hypothetical protein